MPALERTELLAMSRSISNSREQVERQRGLHLLVEHNLRETIIRPNQSLDHPNI
jgi:hypothetical protein